MFTNVEKCNLICGVSTKYLIIVNKISTIRPGSAEGLSPALI